jgi:uncharacterized protein Usg
LLRAEPCNRKHYWLGGGIAYGNIAYQGAQGRRAMKRVELPPAGVIHDYVPFYFAPRSPMLFTINNGNVPDCPYRQQEIIHFVTTVDSIVEAALSFVFYNYNATLDIAECFNDIDQFIRIDWDLFFESPRLDGYCRYWNSKMDNPRYVLRMETRQAEFLVHEAVPLNLIRGIGAFNEAKAQEVRTILAAARVTLPVQAMPGWYF